MLYLGECSDEIFGGYPWYFREDSLSSNTFPWSLAIEERQKILNDDIAKNINLREYIQNEYEKSLSKVEFLETDSIETKIHRKLIYLTSNWFMQTLLDRTDRMAMQNGLEVRVPFCDYRIVEYAWNIPWEMKAYKGREKGLLRYAMEGILPEEIIYRKKSPYPKTHNPAYMRLCTKKIREILADPSRRINGLLSASGIEEIIGHPDELSSPWYGQLMKVPQILAYLIEIDEWLQRYDINIEI